MFIADCLDFNYNTFFGNLEVRKRAVKAEVLDFSTSGHGSHVKIRRVILDMRHI